jgi:hypothetical protein
MKVGKHTNKVSILMIDYDSKNLNRFLHKLISRYKKIKFFIGFSIENLKIYETKRGYHIELILNKVIYPYEIVFYQLLFNSDFTRECLNLRRIKLHIKNWNILYNGKYDKKKKKFYYRKRLFTKEIKPLKIIIEENIKKSNGE